MYFWSSKTSKDIREKIDIFSATCFLQIETAWKTFSSLRIWHFWMDSSVNTQESSSTRKKWIKHWLNFKMPSANLWCVFSVKVIGADIIIGIMRFKFRLGLLHKLLQKCHLEKADNYLFNQFKNCLPWRRV